MESLEQLYRQKKFWFHARPGTSMFHLHSIDYIVKITNKFDWIILYHKYGDYDFSFFSEERLFIPEEVTLIIWTALDNKQDIISHQKI